VLILKGVHFRFNRWKLEKRSFPVLDELADLLEKHPELTIRIEGHTDSVGAKKYNRRLSRKRAESVRAYLASKGIFPSRMTAVGHGKDRPLASNATAEGRGRNRRVEIHFTSPLPPAVRVRSGDAP
jgi:OOP family OmpA-OmpF porin